MKKIIYLFFIIAFVLFLKVEVTEASCTNFSDDFSSTILNTSNWTFSTTRNGGTYQISNAINLTLPSGGSAEGDSFMAINQPISGDFSAEVILQSTENHGISAGGLGLVTKIGSYYLMIGRIAGDSNLGSSLNISTPGNFGHGENTISVPTYLNDPHARVKISRSNNIYSTWYDMMDGNGYHLIKSYDGEIPNPSSDVTVELVVYSINDFPQADGVFDDFALTCSDSTPTATPMPTNCNRCSTLNGCERTQFQSWTSDCVQPIPGSTVIRTTDPSCPQIPGGDNSRCTDVVIITPIINPTINPNCACVSGACVDCGLDRIASTDPAIKYSSPYKCSLPPSVFTSIPSDVQKTSWCRAGKRISGDADGSGVIDTTDYFYYVAAVNGGKIPVTVNPDFNGDGEVGASDRAIIIKTLTSNLTPTWAQP